MKTVSYVDEDDMRININLDASNPAETRKAAIFHMKIYNLATFGHSISEIASFYNTDEDSIADIVEFVKSIREKEEV